MKGSSHYIRLYGKRICSTESIRVSNLAAKVSFRSMNVNTQGYARVILFFLHGTFERLGLVLDDIVF